MEYSENAVERTGCRELLQIVDSLKNDGFYWLFLRKRSDGGVEMDYPELCGYDRPREGAEEAEDKPGYEGLRRFVEGLPDGFYYRLQIYKTPEGGVEHGIFVN